MCYRKAFSCEAEALLHSSLHLSSTTLTTLHKHLHDSIGSCAILAEW